MLMFVGLYLMKYFFISINSVFCKISIDKRRRLLGLAGFDVFFPACGSVWSL